MGTKFKAALVAAVTVLSLSGVQGIAGVSSANHAPAQPPLDLAKLDYTPIGYYGPADEADTPAGESATIPTPSGGPPPLNDPNPSGKFVAYDTNVWESLTLPSRHPGDNCATLASHPDCRSGDLDNDVTDPVARTGYTGFMGPGPDGTETPPNPASNVHGTCPPQPASEPEFGAAGVCFNNQLEYLDYFEHTMETMLADFGVTVKRWPFISPGGTRGGVPAGAPGASGGQAYNIGAVVPGADHPEQTVVVSGHYDFTDTGPTAAWDSAEGHTEVIRMAYIMSDYWRKTGTRPSATVVFSPWDSEESGTFGSDDYVQNNIPPGEEDKVRGYFNVDPCAGAYPAYKDGTTQRVPQVMQLADPEAYPEGSETRARVEAFNAKAETVIDQVLNNLDDSLTTPTGEEPIFVSDAEAAAGNDGTQPVTDSQRDEIVTAVGGLALFTSDYDNFQDVGIPIFNFFPDMFGPHADGTPAESTGISILHTNEDNLTRINRLTSGLTAGNVFDPTGMSASEGWAKGMEFCSQVEATYMLQPEMAGTQTGNTDAVAYFEALPNEAIQNQDVKFDASGSYQYSQVPDTNSATPTPRQPDSALSYSWDFGDGTTGTGQVVNHQYAEIGQYTATLTVTGVGSTDTMTIPITVIGSNFLGPVLEDINDGDAADGQFALNWDFSATRDGFEHFRVEESSDFQVLFSDNAENIANGNWDVETPTHADMEPWQHSDSDTPKFREDNPHRSGARSFWTGFSPPFPQPPTIAAGNSILNIEETFTVPSEGDPQLEYWTLFQNEGDDQGRVEVSLVDPAHPDPHEWMAVDVIQARQTALGGGFDRAVCDPTNPADTLTTGLENRKADLGAFKGKKIKVRFNYVSGPENRIPSQPCGWYIEDISITTGTFQTLGETEQETFQVECRPNGTYAYRVKGVYTDGVTTEASNVEIAEVTNGAKPDLTLTPDDITASRARIIKGRPVTLRATIHNLAAPCAVDATNVRVVFKVFGVPIGDVQTIPTVPGDGTAMASVVWRPNQIGQRRVEVRADPGNKIPEVDESNNGANKYFTVRRR